MCIRIRTGIYIYMYIPIHVFTCTYICVHIVRVSERKGVSKSHELEWKSLCTNFGATPLAAASVGQVLHTDSCVYVFVYVYVHIHICIYLYMYLSVHKYVHI